MKYIVVGHDEVDQYLRATHQDDDGMERFWDLYGPPFVIPQSIGWQATVYQALVLRERAAEVLK